jgi:hypothetical protein
MEFVTMKELMIFQVLGKIVFTEESHHTSGTGQGM